MVWCNWVVDVVVIALHWYPPEHGVLRVFTAAPFEESMQTQPHITSVVTFAKYIAEGCEGCIYFKHELGRWKRLALHGASQFRLLVNAYL